MTDTALPPLGAYGVVEGHGWYAWLIKVLCRTRESHAVVYIGDGNVIEAMPKGAKITPVSRYNDQAVIWNIQEASEFSPEKALKIANFAKTLEGTPYGFLTILACGLLQLGIRWNWLLKHVQNMNVLICSQLVARVYYLAGGIDTANGQPDATVVPELLGERILRRAGVINPLFKD